MGTGSGHRKKEDLLMEIETTGRIKERGTERPTRLLPEGGQASNVQRPTSTLGARPSGCRTSRGGFTLIELLAVLAIMMFMMGLAIGAFQGYGRHAAITSSVLQMKSSLSLARQLAITKRRRTTFVFGNTQEERGYYYLTTNEVASGLIGDTNYLNQGIFFDLSVPNTYTNPITFKLDGACSFGAAPRSISMRERGTGTNRASAILQIYPLTGRVKVLSD